MMIRWFERYPSVLFVLMALTVFGLVGMGVYLQINDPIFVVPCHMCVFQRYLYLIIGILALFGAIFAKISRKTIPIFSLVILGVSALGMYTAGTQSWKQFYPPADAICQFGDDSIYTYIVQNSPLTKVYPLLFEGVGDCYEVGWTFLKLSIANWSFIAFGCCVIAMLLMFFKGGKYKRTLFG